MGSRPRADANADGERSPGSLLGSGMRFFLQAVVYGFGMSLGSALFKKIQGRIGLGEPNEPKDPKDPKEAKAPDPDLPS